MAGVTVVAIAETGTFGNNVTVVVALQPAPFLTTNLYSLAAKPVKTPVVWNVEPSSFEYSKPEPTNGCGIVILPVGTEHVGCTTTGVGITTPFGCGKMISFLSAVHP